MFGFIRKYFSNDLAIDLGTAATRIYVRGKGLVLAEPSVVGLRIEDNDQRSLAAVGREAKQMMGKVPGNIETVQPMKGGVVTDFAVAQDMLRAFIRMTHDSNVFSPNPRIVINVPCDSTQVERRAIREAAMGAGACAVYLIEAPMAAAIGAGLPVAEASGSMVVDIGGGTTEVAVIALGGVVGKGAVKIAGDDFDQAILNYVQRHYGILIGTKTAELVKKQIGSAFPDGETREMEVKGRSLNDGIPRSFRISSNEVLEALNAPLAQIVATIKATLEKTPPEVGADISARGIMLTGGCAQLRNIDRLLTQETDLPVLIADDPETCVVRGSGMALERLDTLGAVFTIE